MTAESAPPRGDHPTTTSEVPGIMRRIAALPYEGLLLLALLLIASFPIAGMKGVALSGAPHIAFQIYLLVVTASYFVWFWRRGGQTLPMKTWRFRIVDANGRPLDLKRALLRFICAMIFYSPACVGIVLFFFPKRISPIITMWAFLPMFATLLWARFDPDGQFLHDRWARTRLVSETAGHGSPHA